MDAVKTWLKEFLTKLFGLLKSRKFWAAVAATIVVVAAGPLDGPAVSKIAAIWIAYIFGTALEDGLRG